jgi:endonuclease/exonuclease/phosphatase family metal-dependent hydrolase
VLCSYNRIVFSNKNKVLILAKIEMKLENMLSKRSYTYMSTEHFIQLLHNTHSSQQLTEPSPKIDHILGHKTSLSKYKKVQIIPFILSDHNAIKLELNNKNKDKKHANS